MAQITRNNRHTERRGTLHRPMRSMFGVTDTSFPDLNSLNSEITLYPSQNRCVFVAELMPVFV